jgi:hypothetical protein
MKKSYPPDEPMAKDVQEILIAKSLDMLLIEKVLKIYSLESLPDDPTQWQGIIVDTNKIVQARWGKFSQTNGGYK